MRSKLKHRRRCHLEALLLIKRMARFRLALFLTLIGSKKKLFVGSSKGSRPIGYARKTLSFSSVFV